MDNKCWIWFQLLFGFGTARSHTMLEENTPEILYAKLSSGDYPERLLMPKERENWRQCMERAKQLEEITYKKKCRIITLADEEYPEQLRHIFAKPVALYVRGDLSCLRDTLVFAMVGSRRCTRYGSRVATFLAEGLVAHGATIASGLAFGIDSIALDAAVKAGGKTVGVLACGLDYDYPKGNIILKREVYQHGAVISEYPMGAKPQPYMFPPRNRVLAGISKGTVVVEAGENSGALITAQCSLDFGRDIFVPPGGVFSGTFVGSHRLLRDGAAKLVATPQDILEDYPSYQREMLRNLAEQEKIDHKRQDTATLTSEPLLNTPSTRTAEEKHPKVQTIGEKPPLPEGMELVVQNLYEALDLQRQTAGELANQIEAPIQEVLGALTTLEILGLAKSYPGGYFTLP